MQRSRKEFWKRDFLNELSAEDLRLIMWVLRDVKQNTRTSLHKYIKELGDLERIEFIKSKLSCAEWKLNCAEWKLEKGESYENSR